MLSIRHFCKRYHQRAVLVIDSLDFPAGAYWIQGENGSGKSTFFKAIAGLIPFEGTIAYNGFDNRKHRIAFHQALLTFAKKRCWQSNPLNFYKNKDFHYCPTKILKERLV